MHHQYVPEFSYFTNVTNKKHETKSKKQVVKSNINENMPFAEKSNIT